MRTRFAARRSARFLALTLAPLGGLLGLPFLAAAQDPPPPMPPMTLPIATLGAELANGRPYGLVHDSTWSVVVPVPITQQDAQLILAAIQDGRGGRAGGGRGGGAGGGDGPAGGRAAPPAPTTHRLMSDLIRAMGGTVESVALSLSGRGLAAVVHIRTSGAEPRDLASRPADALALAIRSGAPLEIDESLVGALVLKDFVALDGDAEIVRAMGMTLTRATQTHRREFTLPSNRPGMVVLNVSDEMAGLGIKRGDLIADINGDTPVSSQTYLAAIARVPPTANIRIVYVRAGEDALLTIPPGKLNRPGLAGR
jgi:hypothetical protein